MGKGGLLSRPLKSWMAGTSPTLAIRKSRTPGCAAARVAFEAGAVAHQREVAAFAAGFTLVAARFGFGAFLRRRGFRMRARFGAVLEFLRRREFRLGLGLERGGAGDFRARGGGGQRGDFGRRSPTRRAARATLPTEGGG